MKFSREWLAAVTFFVQEESGAGGETAQGVGEARANRAGVIEGENPIVLSGGEQFSYRAGNGEERSGGGIDQGAEHARGGGLAAGGRTIENEDGMRSGGAEGGEKPGGEPSGVGVGCEVEGRGQKAGRRWQRAGGSGMGELGVAAAVQESGGRVGSDLPAAWRDFDDFAGGVVQIEKNCVGLARIAAGSDTSMDGKARAARKSASFEGANGLAKRIAGGRLAVAAIEGVDEPVAEAGREDGADLMAEWPEGEADEGLAGGGGEGGGGGGVVEEEFGLGMHWLDLLITCGAVAGASRFGTSGCRCGRNIVKRFVILTAVNRKEQFLIGSLAPGRR